MADVGIGVEAKKYDQGSFHKARIEKLTRSVFVVHDIMFLIFTIAAVPLGLRVLGMVSILFESVRSIRQLGALGG